MAVHGQAGRGRAGGGGLCELSDPHPQRLPAIESQRLSAIAIECCFQSLRLNLLRLNPAIVTFLVAIFQRLNAAIESCDCNRSDSIAAIAHGSAIECCDFAAIQRSVVCDCFLRLALRLKSQRLPGDFLDH